ncbi:MAG TPA: dihydrofolate reductase family protein [Cyclobacteriaceae bacterium]|nr:dihydrofolate reductase family protein [Cyclobacteriaceae bacterium]
MRKVILNVAMSLDGLIEGPNGEYDWCFTDNDYGMTDFMNRIDTVFYGRKSYEMMINAGDGSNPFKQKKNYVFSNKVSEFSGCEVISGDIVSKVKSIKAGKGKDIWLFGGASLTTTLLSHKLVDELLLAVHPIVLGKGKAMFETDERIQTKLIASTPYPSGLVSLHYEVI